MAQLNDPHGSGVTTISTNGTNNTTNRRPLATGRLYHFNVIYNHARCPLSVTADTELSLAWTRKAVENLELTGLVNSYYHDRDCPKGQGLLQELNRVVAASEVTVVLLSPGFVKDCWPRYWLFSGFKSLFTASRLESSSTTRSTSSTGNVDYISESSTSSFRLSPRNSPSTKRASSTSSSLTRLSPYSKVGRSSKKRNVAEGPEKCDVVLVALGLEAGDLPAGLSEEDILFFKDWRKDHEAWSRLEGSLVTSLHASGVQLVRSADRKPHPSDGHEGPKFTSSPRSSSSLTEHKASNETSRVITNTDTNTKTRADGVSSGQVSSSNSSHETNTSTSTTKIMSSTTGTSSNNKTMDEVSSTLTCSSFKTKHDAFSTTSTTLKTSDGDKKTEILSGEIRSQTFSEDKSISFSKGTGVSSSSSDFESQAFLKSDTYKRNTQSSSIVTTFKSESERTQSSHVHGSVQHSSLSLTAATSPRDVHHGGIQQQRREIIKVTEKVQSGMKKEHYYTEKLHVSGKSSMRVDHGPVTSLVPSSGRDSADGDRSPRSEKTVLSTTEGSGHSQPKAMRIEKSPVATFAQSSEEHSHHTGEASQLSRNLTSVYTTAHRAEDKTVAGPVQKVLQSEVRMSGDGKEASSVTMSQAGSDVESAVLNRLGQAGIKREFTQKKSTTGVIIEGDTKTVDGVYATARFGNQKEEQMTSTSQSISTQKSLKEMSNSALAFEDKRNASLQIKNDSFNKDHELHSEKKLDVIQSQTMATNSAEAKSRYLNENSSQKQDGVTLSEITTQESACQSKQSVAITETVTTVCGTEQQIISQRRFQSQTKASYAQASSEKDHVDSTDGADINGLSVTADSDTFEEKKTTETGISGNQSTDTTKKSRGKKISLPTDYQDQSSAVSSATVSNKSHAYRSQQQLHDSVKLSEIEIWSSNSEEEQSVGSVYHHVTSIEDDHDYLTSSLASSGYGTMSPRNDLSLQDDSGFLSGGLAQFGGSGTSETSVTISGEKKKRGENHQTDMKQQNTSVTLTTTQSLGLVNLDSATLTLKQATSSKNMRGSGKNLESESDGRKVLESMPVTKKVQKSGDLQESWRSLENTSKGERLDIHTEEGELATFPPPFDRVSVEKPLQQSSAFETSGASAPTFDSSYDTERSDYAVSSTTTTTTTFTNTHFVDNKVIRGAGARANRSASDLDDPLALERRDSWIYQDVDRKWTVAEVLLPLYRLMIYMVSRPEMPYM